jgi:hypothetical protein
LSPTSHHPPLLLVTKHSKNSRRGLKNTISSFLARPCITGQPSRNIQDIPLLGWLQCSIVTVKAVLQTKLAPTKHFKNISRFNPRINEKKLFQ